MTLCGRRRDKEAKEFLDWLAGVIERESVDLLLVTGDIFDNGSPPSATSQSLYYRFLTAAAAAGCRHIIITAGNHDSPPAFLEAPREILEPLNIHIVGKAGAGHPGGTFLLDRPDGKPECIVAAVPPYLRDRDIRHSTPPASLLMKKPYRSAKGGSSPSIRKLGKPHVSCSLKTGRGSL